ncbi:MAG: hypothetical protein QM710_10545 [Flavobacterium sp.]
MANFQFPSDGSVIIIDDIIDDALPLMQLLSQRGIATTYYSGKSDNDLPEEPVQKVRYAFIDIQLFPAGDANSYAQNIKRLLERIVPLNNGPYILMIWSTVEFANADAVEALLLMDNFIRKPAGIVRLQKADFFITENDNSIRDQLIEDINEDMQAMLPENDIQAINNFIINRFPLIQTKRLQPNALNNIANRLNERLHGTNAFHLFILWERLVNKSSGDIVNNYSSLHQKNIYWEENLKHSIYRMAKAQLGMTVNDVSENELLKNALKTMNSTFIDSLENKLSVFENISSTIKIDKGNILYLKDIAGSEYKIRLKKGKYSLFIDGARMPPGSTNEAANIETLKKWSNGNQQILANIISIVDEFLSITPDINTKLLFDILPPSFIQPGNVFEKDVPNWKRRRNLLGDYFGKEAISKKNNQQQFEISNDDLKKVIFIELEVTPLCDYVQNKWRKSRLVSGVLVPKELEKRLQKSASHYLYDEIPLVKINGQLYKPVIDFRLFKSIDISKTPLAQPPLFRVRSELFADILSRLSSHASRVGIAYLE